jgi:hypothetical protein
MAFHDHLARDPKSEKEFWAIIEETFEQVEPTLTTYPVETREEALESQRFSPGDSIRYRGVSEGYDSRGYFLQLGRRVLLDVEPQIKARKLTRKFAKDWGVVMMCHGFIAAHVLDDSDGLGNLRGGLKRAALYNRDAQRKWIAHLFLHWIDRGIRRKAAEANAEKHIKSVIQNGGYPPRFPTSWFELTLINGTLSQTYNQQHLSSRKLRELKALPKDDIPPIKFPP